MLEPRRTRCSSGAVQYAYTVKRARSWHDRGLNQPWEVLPLGGAEMWDLAGPDRAGESSVALRWTLRPGRRITIAPWWCREPLELVAIGKAPRRLWLHFANVRPVGV